MAFAADDTTTLSCQTKATERTLLKQASGKAKRVSKRVLVVTTANGPQRFNDEPPFDEALGGIRWHYCGYDAKAKVHLIGKDDETVFSGVLLRDENGKQLPAGHTVFFSPDRHAFVAVEQPDGLDGENWTLHDAAGTVTWTGYAGILAKEPGSFVSQFTKPRWTEHGELMADYVCAGSDNDKDGSATLVKSPSGKWRWRAQGKCPSTTP